MTYRQLNSEEIAATKTLNCCANAIADNLPKVERRLKNSNAGRYIGLVKGLHKVLCTVVRLVIEESPDEDQQQMIITRMSRLQLQFGYVRKHPESLVIMTPHDADLLLAPVLDRCDLDCP